MLTEDERCLIIVNTFGGNQEALALTEDGLYEVLMQTILASGENREMWFLTEEGLYEVLMQSRKLIAKTFKKGAKKITLYSSEK